MSKNNKKAPKNENRVGRKGRKSGFKKALKIIFSTGFVLFIALIAAGLVFHFATRENPDKYISDDFTAYARIESISELFDSMMNLQAAKYVIANDSLASFYNLYNTLKSNSLLNSFAGKWLLNVDTSLILDSENRVSVVIDMGIRSLATRLVDVVDRLEMVEGLQLSYSTDEYRIYRFAMEEQTPFFLTVKNNLVIVSPDEGAIIELFRSASMGKTIHTLPQLDELKKRSTMEGMVNFYLRTGRLLEQVGGSSPLIQNFVENTDMGDFALVSLSLSDDQFEMGVTSQFEVPGEAGNRSEIAEVMSRIIEFDPSHTGVQRLLPANANLVTSLRFENFKEFYKLYLFLNDKDYKRTSRNIDNLLKLALKSDSDELFFSWMGQEAGMFFLEGSMDPVIFIHMQDPGLQKKVFRQLDKSIFLTSDLSKRVDGVPLGKIGFPDGLMPLLNMVRRGLDAPYYVTEDDYLFLSMNGEDLASVVNSYKEGNKLVRDVDYQKASRATSSSRSNIFAYYNLNSAMPALIKKDSLVGNILSLYAKGTLSFEFDDGYLQLSTQAAGKRVSDSINYPGYPRVIKDGVSSWIYSENVIGSRADEFLYLDDDNNLVILDASFNQSKMPVQSDSDIIPYTRTKDKRVFVSSRKGSLYCADGMGNAIDPFPIETGFVNSFTPVVFEKGLLYFSKKDKKFFHLSLEGEEKVIDYEFAGEVFYPPAVRDELLAVYPRSFSGQVFLIDKEGALQAGWPVTAGGISQSGPVFLQDRFNHTRVTFLTQAGNLNCWDLAGENVIGFPVKLEGVYFGSPVSMQLSDGQEALVLLDEEGVLSVVSLSGVVLQSKSIPMVAGKSSRLLTYDADRNGENELYIYGDFNYIVGLDDSLLNLKGFPIKGSGMPSFSDLDFDGKEELICFVYDKDGKDKLFAYYVTK